MADKDQRNSRDEEILKDFRNGMIIRDLSKKYNLSKVRIRGILRPRTTSEEGKGQAPMNKEVRPILSPKGSQEGIEGKSGYCECCGKEFPAEDIIRRIPRIIGYTPEDEPIMTGVKVCRRCSPYYEDGILRRYELPITEWYAEWLTGSNQKVVRK
jgi:hypothetical protein